MKDIMVSIRMPETLLSELKSWAEEEHYMDVSEQIRTIVRDKWIEDKQPELMQLKKLREDIGKELKEKREKIVTRELARELEKIKDDIKKEGLLK
ncbi:MAG: hypothetical protein U9O94_04065 [Nanoarchaeota archaeon]|nr:hypothetical protein [Nanoarchaeota archaeon]